MSEKAIPKHCETTEQPKGYSFLEYLTRPGADNQQPRGDTAQEILDKLDALNRRLDVIFGDNVIVDGKWESLNLLRKRLGSGR